MKQGMTLIEIVVALALSALLLGTTAGVIKAMHERKKVFADRLDIQPWRIELAQALRNDLLRSQNMRIGSRTLELLGNCGHDPVTGEQTYSPVHIRWSLKREGDYDILVRTEIPHGGLEELTATPRPQLMAVDVTGLSLGTFTGLDNIEQNEMQTLTARGRISDEPGDWSAIPKVLKLVVRGRGDVILIDELIYR